MKTTIKELEMVGMIEINYYFQYFKFIKIKLSWFIIIKLIDFFTINVKIIVNANNITITIHFFGVGCFWELRT